MHTRGARLPVRANLLEYAHCKFACAHKSASICTAQAGLHVRANLLALEPRKHICMCVQIYFHVRVSRLRVSLAFTHT